tara:strand:- start:6425 stop:6568 length:144 start_codon:yes stop_codon:yes gene_type:complete
MEELNRVEHFAQATGTMAIFNFLQRKAKKTWKFRTIYVRKGTDFSQR